MTLPLEGIKVIDFTVMQAGPVCTQLLAWFGADVLKIERPGKGDVTRKQFRDIPDADALYFTMVNGNKRSIEINTKTPEGKEILEKLIQQSDVMVENLSPGTLDRMGFTWEHIHQLNQRLVFGSIKGFGEKSRYSTLKAYENVAQCAGGVASITGFWDGPPTVSGSALGDSNTGMHLAIGILAALRMRDKTGIGQKVSVSMQDSVLNLCRSKLRDQLRLESLGYLEEYPQYPEMEFGDVVPRAGNASGSTDPGMILKCKGWESDPNAYIYIIIQQDSWRQLTQLINRSHWADDPEYNTSKARRPKLKAIFKVLEESFLVEKSKDEAVDILRKYNIPCAPIKSMKEIAHDPELRDTGTIVEVEHKVRGKYLTVGSPIKFSNFTPIIKPSPLLGEHTDEVLKRLGYNHSEIVDLHEKKVVAATFCKFPKTEPYDRTRVIRDSLEKYLSKNIYTNEGRLSI